MAILSKKGIINALKNGDLGITPFNEDQLNPNSYDIRIDKWIAFYVLNDNDYDNKATQFGIIDKDFTPDIYGHAYALNIHDPQAKMAVTWPLFDLADPQHSVQVEIDESGFIIYPGNVYCVRSEEEFDCKRVIAELSGKSSIARSGVTVHNTAGYCNVGDKFKYILEITCTFPTLIYPHMKLAQVLFHEIDDLYDPKEDKYDGVYSSYDPEQVAIRMYCPDPELTKRAHAAQEALEAHRAELEAQAAEAIENLKNVADEAKEAVENSPFAEGKEIEIADDSDKIERPNMKVIDFTSRKAEMEEESEDDEEIPEEIAEEVAELSEGGCNGNYCAIPGLDPEVPEEEEIVVEEPEPEYVDIDIDELFTGKSGLDVETTDTIEY